MHTPLVILGGFLLLGLVLIAGRLLGDGEPEVMVIVAKIFIPIWLVCALLNMWMGAAAAGYLLASELPVFLLVFSMPAVAAVFIWWRFS